MQVGGFCFWGGGERQVATFRPRRRLRSIAEDHATRRMPRTGARAAGALASPPAFRRETVASQQTGRQRGVGATCRKSSPDALLRRLTAPRLARTLATANALCMSPPTHAPPDACSACGGETRSVKPITVRSLVPDGV